MTAAEPTAFLIDGERWDVIDWYEPDPTVGMFGEYGAWVCRADTDPDTEVPLEDQLFVVMPDGSVYDQSGQEPTGQRATVLS